MVHEYATHHLRGDGEELRAALPAGIVLGVESQPCLVHKRCGLECLPFALVAQRAARLSPQLRIHEPSECLACVGVPRAPGAEELSDLVGRCIGARCWIGVNMNRLCRAEVEKPA